MVLVGTCRDLERGYLRTAPTRPEEVRSEDVLRAAMEHVLQKGERFEGKSRYEYVMGQLKGVRQDLSVQGLVGEFTIDVYGVCLEEALSAGDRGEYALCHAALRELGTDVHVMARLLFQYLMGGQSIDVESEVCRLIGEGVRHPVLSFIVNAASSNTHCMRLSYAAMSAPLQRVYQTFSHAHRLHFLEHLLRSCGPTKLPPAAISHHLILPLSEVESFVSSVTGLNPPPCEAKPLLEALRTKREQLRRADFR